MARSTPLDRVAGLVETALYVAVAALLAGGALAVLVATGWNVVQELDDGTVPAVEHLLDGLLLVFIFVELLAAVRTTLNERSLVAEPFLLVGIIASIKEIVVLAATQQDEEDLPTRIAVLGAVVLALGVTAFFMRRKEREPAEDGGGLGEKAERGAP